MEEKLKGIKSLIRSVLVSNQEALKRGITAQELLRDYKDITCELIPYKQYGCSDITSFARLMPDTIQIIQYGGEPLFKLVSSEDTKHIENLVARQRASKKKSSKSRSLKGSMRRPSGKPSWLKPTRRPGPSPAQKPNMGSHLRKSSNFNINNSRVNNLHYFRMTETNEKNRAVESSEFESKIVPNEHSKNQNVTSSLANNLISRLECTPDLKCVAKKQVLSNLQENDFGDNSLTTDIGFTNDNPCLHNSLCQCSNLDLGSKEGPCKTKKYPGSLDDLKNSLIPSDRDHTEELDLDEYRDLIGSSDDTERSNSTDDNSSFCSTAGFNLPNNEVQFDKESLSVLPISVLEKASLSTNECSTSLSLESKELKDALQPGKYILMDKVAACERKNTEMTEMELFNDSVCGFMSNEISDMNHEVKALAPGNSGDNDRHCAEVPLVLHFDNNDKSMDKSKISARQCEVVSARILNVNDGNNVIQEQLEQSILDFNSELLPSKNVCVRNISCNNQLKNSTNYTLFENVKCINTDVHLLNTQPHLEPLDSGIGESLVCLQDIDLLNQTSVTDKRCYTDPVNSNIYDSSFCTNSDTVPIFTDGYRPLDAELNEPNCWISSDSTGDSLIDEDLIFRDNLFADGPSVTLHYKSNGSVENDISNKNDKSSVQDNLLSTSNFAKVGEQTNTTRKAQANSVPQLQDMNVQLLRGEPQVDFSALYKISNPVQIPLTTFTETRPVTTSKVTTSKLNANPLLNSMFEIKWVVKTNDTGKEQGNQNFNPWQLPPQPTRLLAPIGALLKIQDPNMLITMKNKDIEKTGNSVFHSTSYKISPKIGGGKEPTDDVNMSMNILNNRIASTSASRTTYPDKTDINVTKVKANKLSQKQMKCKLIQSTSCKKKLSYETKVKANSTNVKKEQLCLGNNTTGIELNPLVLNISGSDLSMNDKLDIKMSASDVVIVLDDGNQEEMGIKEGPVEYITKPEQSISKKSRSQKGKSCEKSKKKPQSKKCCAKYKNKMASNKPKETGQVTLQCNENPLFVTVIQKPAPEESSTLNQKISDNQSTAVKDLENDLADVSISSIQQMNTTIGNNTTLNLLENYSQTLLERLENIQFKLNSLVMTYPENSDLQFLNETFITESDQMIRRRQEFLLKNPQPESVTVINAFFDFRHSQLIDSVEQILKNLTLFKSPENRKNSGNNDCIPGKIQKLKHKHYKSIGSGCNSVSSKRKESVKKRLFDDHLESSEKAISLKCYNSPASSASKPTGCKSICPEQDNGYLPEHFQATSTPIKSIGSRNIVSLDEYIDTSLEKHSVKVDKETFSTQRHSYLSPTKCERTQSENSIIILNGDDQSTEFQCKGTKNLNQIYSNDRAIIECNLSLQENQLAAEYCESSTFNGDAKGQSTYKPQKSKDLCLDTKGTITTSDKGFAAVGKHKFITIHEEKQLQDMNNSGLANQSNKVLQLFHSNSISGNTGKDTFGPRFTSNFSSDVSQDFNGYGKSSKPYFSDKAPGTSKLNGESKMLCSRPCVKEDKKHEDILLPSNVNRNINISNIKFINCKQTKENDSKSTGTCSLPTLNQTVQSFSEQLAYCSQSVHSKSIVPNSNVSGNLTSENYLTVSSNEKMKEVMSQFGGNIQCQSYISQNNRKTESCWMVNNVSNSQCCNSDALNTKTVPVYPDGTVLPNLGSQVNNTVQVQSCEVFLVKKETVVQKTVVGNQLGNEGYVNRDKLCPMNMPFQQKKQPNVADVKQIEQKLEKELKDLLSKITDSNKQSNVCNDKNAEEECGGNLCANIKCRQHGMRDPNLRRHNIRRGLLPKVAIKIMERWYEQNIKHPYPSQDTAEVIANSGGINVEQRHAVVENRGNIQVNIKQPIPALNAQKIKFGDQYEIPPRFQKMKEAGQIVTPEKYKEVDFEFSSPQQSWQLDQEQEDFIAKQIANIRRETPSVNSGADYNTISSEEPRHGEITKDYKSAINLYVQHHKYAKPVYEPVYMGNQGILGYKCHVIVNNKTFDSGDLYKTKKEAEHAAAKYACSGLGLNMAKLQDISPSKRSSPPRRTESELKRRVMGILQKKPNGLWNSRLPVEYKQEYSEDLPMDIGKLLSLWQESIKIEEVEGTDRTILYPILPGSVKLKQSQISSGNVPNIVIPKVGSKVVGFVCYVKTPSEFYIHRSDIISSISSLEERIKEIYDMRGGPKSLLSASPGMFCVAQYQENWYRAKIINIVKGPPEKYDVFFVDYGNYETVQGHLVRRILDNLCELPAQALRCSLADVYPLNIKWGKGEHKKFIDLYDFNQEVFLDIVSVEDRSCAVKLFASADINISLNEIFVNEGHARSVLLPAEPGPITLPVSNEWAVNISYIESTTRVIIRLYGDEYSKNLEKLEQDDLPKLDNTKFSDKELMSLNDCMCAIRLIEDDGEFAWHRVRVINVSENVAEVYFPDYGDSDKFSVECLRPLPLEYNQLPYQAIPCKLRGLESFENDQRVLEALEEYLYRTVPINVHERHDQLSVTLWDTDTDDNIDININEKVSKVLTPEDLKPKLPMVGETTNVFVSHVTDEGEIFVNIQGPGLVKLEEMCDEIKAIYSKSVSSLFLSKPEKGIPCVAKYVEENEEGWYRTIIKAVYPKQRKARVFYVDYGNEETTLLSNLRALSQESENLKSLPMQAVKCSLYGLPPKDSEFTDEAVIRIKEQCPFGEVRELRMMRCAPDEMPQVEIYDMSSNEKELIGLTEILLEENVFNKIGDSESEDEVFDNEKSNWKINNNIEAKPSFNKEVNTNTDMVISNKHMNTEQNDSSENLELKVKKELNSSFKQLYIDVTVGQDLIKDSNSFVYSNANASHKTSSQQNLSLYLPATPKSSPGILSKETDPFAKSPISPDSLPYLPVSPDRDVVEYKDMLAGYDVEVEEPLQTSGSTTPKTPTSTVSPLNKVAPRTVGVNFPDNSILPRVTVSPRSYVAPTPNKSIDSIAGHGCNKSPTNVDASLYVAPTPDVTSSTSIMQNSPVLSSPVQKVQPSPMDFHSQSYDTTVSVLSCDKDSPGSQMDTSKGHVPAESGDGVDLDNVQEGQILTIETGGESSDSCNKNNISKRFLPTSQLYTDGGVLDPIIDVDENDSEDESNENNNSNTSDEGFKNKADAVAFLQEATMVMDPDSLDTSGMSVDEDIDPNTLVLPPAPVLPNSGDSVFITMVESPTDFRCVQQANMEELSNMMESMLLYYSTQNEKLKVTPDTAEEGQVYAGLHEDFWYRVCIKKIVGDQAAILFVDYGDYIVLPVSKLRILSAQFRTLPFLAIKAKLAGVHHPGNNWSREACARMHELVQEKFMTAWVHGMDGDFLIITLVDTQSEINAFIHKILLSEGYAAKPNV